MGKHAKLSSLLQLRGGEQPEGTARLNISTQFQVVVCFGRQMQSQL